MADVKMVTVDGVRYRPEDAPKQRTSKEDDGAAEHKMRTPRKSSNK